MYDIWNLWNDAFEKFSCTISNIYIGFSRFWGQIQWINFGFYSHFNPFIYWDVFMDSKILFSEPFILNNVFWGNFWHFVLFENMLASSEVKVSFPGAAPLWGWVQLVFWNWIFTNLQVWNPFFSGCKATKNQSFQNQNDFLGLKTDPDLVKSNFRVCKRFLLLSFFIRINKLVRTFAFS